MRHAPPVLRQIQPKLQHMQARIQGGFQHSTARIDASLHGLQPWQIAAVTAVVVLITDVDTVTPAVHICRREGNR